MKWQDAAEKNRQAITAPIPEKWKLQLDQSTIPEDVRGIPASCGILPREQIWITEHTAVDLVRKLASGELSSVAVVEAFCARAAIAHQLVNCLTTYFSEEGLKRAAEMDEQMRAVGKPVGPLHGLPIALKDTYDVVGKPTTYGYAANINHRAERDSAVVKILRDAGAVFYVKTTMPQTAQAFGNSQPSLHGSPFAPSTDIGGSIRAPAAFNGLYGIRPSADRIPKRGMQSIERGQPNVKVSCGPVTHCVADLELMTRILNAYPAAKYDPTCVPIRWREVPKPSGKLAFGILEFDGAVTPTPPILRSIRETAAKLRDQVVEFKVPFDSWECSQTTFQLYYQNGITDTMDLLAECEEEMLPAVTRMLEIYPPIYLNAKQVMEYKELFADAWDNTAKVTTTGRPIDGLICPVSPSAGFPHDFLPYWGYTSLFNILDYPSLVLPLKNFKITERQDSQDKTTLKNTSSSNPFEEAYRTISSKLFVNQPVAIQIVARPFEDEELLRLTEVLDNLLNKPFKKPIQMSKL
ncbi:amidase [Tothia fuscella]|uniref:Amidase n=1 Tax=Tothia fuscella TaxID=1048955 RepID=A0A9P4TZ68_9PEZI|nr:amidase [Tothia fuscella]